MKVTIEIEVPDEYADEEDETGLTEEGFDLVMDALSGISESIYIAQT